MENSEDYAGGHEFFEESSRDELRFDYSKAGYKLPCSHDCKCSFF